MSQRDPAASERFFLRLVEFVEVLIEHPEIGRMVPDYEIPELRQRIFAGSYRVIHRSLTASDELRSRNQGSLLTPQLTPASCSRR
ncbi:MAG: type II toxin-antitoxin system RelE/ParE family toxin [Vulcanimicrobiota bacterium]